MDTYKSYWDECKISWFDKSCQPHQKSMFVKYPGLYDSFVSNKFEKTATKKKKDHS